MVTLQPSDKTFDETTIISANMDFSRFNCSNADFNDFIKNEALDDCKNNISVTYVGMIKDQPAAFVTLVAAAYRTEFLKTIITGIHKYRQIPAIKIARIATDKLYQRRGCGEALVQHSVAIGFLVQKHIGCKLIITDALPDKVPWYEKQGFVPSMKIGMDPARENCPMYAVLSE